MNRLLLFLALTVGWSLRAADFRAPGVPKDWKIELLAQAPDIRHPSVVCSAPDGRIFVAEDPMDISAPADAKQGRVICFHPDGRRTVYATNLHAVFGMQYLEGHLYLLHNPKFSAFRDLGNHGTNAFDLIDSTNPNPWALDWNDHIPANFKLGMDGYFYLAVGDKGLFNARGRDGRTVNLHGGGIARIRPDGSGLEIFSTGVRNILDVALNSEDEIFTYDNTDEHNWMGRLTHMVDGGFYGYPHDFAPRRPYTLWMMHDFGAGAACGTLAYTEDALPAEYHDDLFLSDFGKRQVTRVKVERDGATYRVARHEEFFTNQPDDFRPVGIAWSADGLSLLVCDWQHRDVKENVTVGRVWKVSYAGKSQAQQKPAWYTEAARGKSNSLKATSAELFAGLSHRSREVRMTAQRTLAQQQQSLAALEKLALETKAAVLPRTHALWAIQTIDADKAAVTARALLNDSDPMLRRQALRQLGDSSPAPSATPIYDRLHDTNVSVRFHAATALGRLADTNAIITLLNRLNDPDLFTRYAIFTALNRIGHSHPSARAAIAAGLTNDNARIAEGTEFALRETYDESLLPTLIALTETSTATLSVRERALRLIAALHHQTTPWKGEWWAYHPALSPAPRRTMAWNGTPKVIEQLRRSLDSSDDARLNLIAVEGLREANDTNSAPALQQAFRNARDESLLRSIISTFATWRHQESGVFLADMIENGKLLSDALKEELIRALATIAHPGAERVLLNESARTNLSSSTRLALIDGFGALRSTNAVSYLRQQRDPTIQSNVIRSLSRIGGAEAERHLQSLLTSAEIQTQLLAITALGEIGDARALNALLQAWRKTATRWAAIEALARIKDMRALDAYLDGLSSPNPALREQVRKALGTMRDAALKSIEQKNHLPPQVLAELRVIFAGHPALKSSSIFASAAKGLDLQDYRAFALTNAGNARHGQVIFFDESGVACLKCHAVGAHGGNVGPDLTTIGKQFPRSDLIDHLLYPSKAVREGYQQYLIETRDGESYSGAIRGEDAETVTLIDASAKMRVIAKREIVSRKASELSLMPEGLHAGLSLEQFSDLIAFMESRQADARVAQPRSAPAGFTSLFNGRDLSDWKAVAGWTATNGLLLHLGHGDHLWTKREFEDFTLKLEWRWPDAPKIVEFPVIDRDGHDVFLAPGKPKMERVLDAGDSGVFLRGFPKAQANLFCYPIGSGESWDYRTDPKMTAEQRRAVTPRLQADRPIGDWNEMEITLRENRLSVRLNGYDVIINAELPGLPPRGPIGLQHEHGRIEFRNLFILRGGTN